MADDGVLEGRAAALLERGAALATVESSDETFPVPPGAAILDAAIDAGVELAHGCRNGVCGACAVEIVEGACNVLPPDAIEANSLSRFKLPRNSRLACRAMTRGPVKIRPA